MPAAASVRMSSVRCWRRRWPRSRRPEARRADHGGDPGCVHSCAHRPGGRGGFASGRVLLASAPYAHPEFPRARTRTPLLVGIDAGAKDLYGEERFGPIGFVITTDDRDAALAEAAADARAGRNHRVPVFHRRAVHRTRRRGVLGGGCAAHLQPHRADAAQFRRGVQRLPRNGTQSGGQRDADGPCFRGCAVSHHAIAGAGDLTKLQP